MKILLIIISLLFLSCTSRMENQKLEDYGKLKIGDNLYIQKFVIGNDRIYILVDDNNKIVSGQTTTSFQVRRGKTTHSESNSFFGN